MIEIIILLAVHFTINLFTLLNFHKTEPILKKRRVKILFLCFGWIILSVLVFGGCVVAIISGIYVGIKLVFTKED